MDEQTTVAHVSEAAKAKAEKILIGAMLREPYNMPAVINLLNPVALSNASNGLGASFAEILKQFTERGTYSAVSVSARTGDQLIEYAASDSELDLPWAAENWVYEYGKWSEAKALISGVSPESMAAGAERMRQQVEETRIKLGALTQVTDSGGAERFMEIAIDKLEGREEVYKTSFPVPEFTQIVKHFKPKNLWVVAGRPGMGKTFFGLNLASAFHDNGAKGIFFSLEMGAEDLFMRLMGVRHGINPNADWSGLDKKEVGNAISEVADLKNSITVIDNAFSILEIEAAATAKFYQGGIDYIIVDYLQLVTAAGKQGNREAEVGSVADALMRLSNRLKVPVISLAQLSRAVEARGGSKRPTMSDLRESGRIEQSAYGIIFLYRPEYYGILEDETGRSLVDIGEVIVAKHRNGDVGTVKMRWNKVRGYSSLPENYESAFQSPYQNFNNPIPHSSAPAHDVIDYSTARPSLTADDLPF